MVQVQAGLSRGTGFLVGSELLVVTNEHVIEDAPDAVSVILPKVASDSTQRIPARVVASDRGRDLAVLRINPGQCAACRPLTLAEGAPVPGMHVAAVGFPLSQPLTITSGIVAAVREGAIISDVSLNPGNSGGPLLSMDGHVVGINTFQATSATAGPGVSGSLLVTQLAPLLQKARGTSPPPAARLPVLPSRPYPIRALRAAAESIPVDEYDDDMGPIRAGNFEIRVTTPVSHFVAVRAFEEEVGEERHHRERLAGVPESERYSAFEPYRAWVRYVGTLTQPSITISVTPTVGESFGSALARALNDDPQAKLRFEGDVGGVRLYRNGEEVSPVLGGQRVDPVLINTPFKMLRDVAGEGYYVYRPEAFRPEPDGTPPSIVVWITDLANPQDSLADRYQLPPETVARAWNDFAGYAAVTFVGADPERFHSWCYESERWPEGWPAATRVQVSGMVRRTVRYFCQDL